MTDNASRADLRPRDHWPTHGWQESAPADQHMDTALLIEAGDVLAAQHPNLNGLLVARHGVIVYERYGEGAGPDRLHNVKSVTKSVLSALVGIAVQTGDLESIEATLGTLVPEWFTSTSDPRKRAIRVRDLLEMRSGIEWAEWGSCTVEMTASKHWVNFVLAQPNVAEPGQRYNYSTGDSQLLAAVLQKLTGMTLLDFADLYLFGPLGITQRTWPADPQGVTIGGAELSLSPRDMAKFGTLYLNQGRWEGDVILAADWVRASTTQQALVVPPDASDRPPIGYGWLWWLRAQEGHASWLAVGYGGQFVIVIPDLDLVIVMTGDLRRVPKLFSDNRMIREFNLVAEYIVPAVLDR